MTTQSNTVQVDHPATDRDTAVRFARHWIASWNSHDLDAIMSHYAEDFEMSSPVIRQIAGQPAGVLKGRERVRQYWARALKLSPHLRFELLDTYCGANSVAIHYRGHRGLGVEVFLFNAEGQVVRAFAHYLEAP